MFSLLSPKQTFEQYLLVDWSRLLGGDTTTGCVGSVAGNWPTDGSDKRYEMTNPSPNILAAL
jgi:hypothetical protein